MKRLRDLATQLRRQDRDRKTSLTEIEDRLRAKGAQRSVELHQVIISSTNDEWKETVEFLEEFEAEDLLPIPLQRLLIGGHTLLDHGNAAGNS